MRSIRVLAAAGLRAAVFGAVLATAPTAAQDWTERVSVSSAGVQGNGPSYSASLSADGRYAAFSSEAYNLTPGDTNSTRDIFVRDRQGGTTERVSVTSAGAQGNGDCSWTSISGDGRYVAFASAASNLVAGDTNGAWDVFVRDRLAGTTVRVSVGSAGEEANGSSFCPSISADGRWVALCSFATNMVGDDTNGVKDVFVHDLANGSTERVSVSWLNLQSAASSDGPSISADGRYVAFFSAAADLAPDPVNGNYNVFVRDRLSGTTELVSPAVGVGDSYEPRISADGRYVAFSSSASDLVQGDLNQAWDAFVRDRDLALTELVSVSSAGEQGNSGSWVENLSADNRYVLVWSPASNLAPDDHNGEWDIFLRDRVAGTTALVSLAHDGTQADGESSDGFLSADGRFASFSSTATNLVPGDGNGVKDVFVRGPLPVELVFRNGFESGDTSGWRLTVP